MRIRRGKKEAKVSRGLAVYFQCVGNGLQLSGVTNDQVKIEIEQALDEWIEW